MHNWLPTLIAVSAVITTRFATIAAANACWSASR